jgi:hypothetical protein
MKSFFLGSFFIWSSICVAFFFTLYQNKTPAANIHYQWPANITICLNIHHGLYTQMESIKRAKAFWVCLCRLRLCHPYTARKLQNAGIHWELCKTLDTSIGACIAVEKCCATRKTTIHPNFTIVITRCRVHIPLFCPLLSVFQSLPMAGFVHYHPQIGLFDKFP